MNESDLPHRTGIAASERRGFESADIWRQLHFRWIHTTEHPAEPLSRLTLTGSFYNGINMSRNVGGYIAAIQDAQKASRMLRRRCHCRAPLHRNITDYRIGGQVIKTVKELELLEKQPSRLSGPCRFLVLTPRRLQTSQRRLQRCKQIR